MSEKSSLVEKEVKISPLPELSDTALNVHRLTGGASVEVSMGSAKVKIGTHISPMMQDSLMNMMSSGIAWINENIKSAAAPAKN